MKKKMIVLFFGLISLSAYADPRVGVKAIYDYKREVNGKIENYAQTKEVLSVDPDKKTYSEKTTYLDGNVVVKEGTIGDQSFEMYQISDVFFAARCATALNGKTVNGVKYSFESVTVPKGTYMACHMSFAKEGLIYDEYVADDVTFNTVKTIIVDPATGMVRTSELRSIVNAE